MALVNVERYQEGSSSLSFTSSLRFLQSSFSWVLQEHDMALPVLGSKELPHVLVKEPPGLSSILIPIPAMAIPMRITVMIRTCSMIMICFDFQL